ncbi:hypothetical protein J437_LFUL014975 [Ladona fulva]|uniref:Uncharacterized protein n=1 Tax=Ladona fulva TaxID=123851 RepID=A0A8K0P5R2_LADFU|nr:hypothetical protein J437_LFUL014975 [Ladona fulva]
MTFYLKLLSMTELSLVFSYLQSVLRQVLAALDLLQQLIELLSLRGHPLGKWANNSQELLINFPKEDCEATIQFQSLEFASLKVLGIFWASESDSFSYCIEFDPSANSRRMILSSIVRIYNTIGGAAPVIFWMKCFLLSLWALKTEFATLFWKIEAVLNPQTLKAKSSDTGENDYLTPGHFLVGHRPLISLPESISDEAMHLPTQRKLIEQLFQHFRRQWSQEYMHPLQQ